MRSPREAVVSITETCDYKCQMCHIRSGPRLPLSVIGRLPKSLRNVTLTGGEPFLLSNLPDYVAATLDRLPGCRIVIVTNGGRPDRIESLLKKCCIVPAVRVSLDGLEGTHDRIRGVPGAFQAAQDTIQRLSRFVQDLGISMTAMDENVGEIRAVAGLSKSMGCRFSLQVVHNSSLFYKTMANPALTRTNELRRELAWLRRQALLSRNLRDAAKGIYYEALDDYVQGKPRRLFCDAGGTFIYVGVRGDVYPCLLLDDWHRMGSLVESTWEEIVDSSAAERERRFVKVCPIQCCQTCTVAPVVKAQAIRLAPGLAVRMLMERLR